MFCETCRRRAAEGALDPQPAEFYASLLDAMHSMAQPLTLLSSHFYLSGPASAGSQAAQQLQVDAEDGVEHLCTIFRLMQELVHVQSSAAHPTPVPFAGLLQSLAADAEAVFAGTGHRFEVRDDPGREMRAALETGQLSASSEEQWDRQTGANLLPSVTIDPKRTRLALVSMLHMAREGAQTGSAVICRIVADEHWLTVRLEPERTLEDLSQVSFDEVTRLHLALARANMLGQSAVFCLATQPFSLCLELPVHSLPDSEVRAAASSS